MELHRTVIGGVTHHVLLAARCPVPAVPESEDPLVESEPGR